MSPPSGRQAGERSMAGYGFLGRRPAFVRVKAQCGGASRNDIALWQGSFFDRAQRMSPV